MFLKILKLVEEIEMVFAEMLGHLLDGMLVPAPLQSNANETLVTLNSSVQPCHEAVNGAQIMA